MNLEVLMFILYGLILGWLLHSKKHDIVWFFKEHSETILVYLICIGWPLISIALFWLNILILNIDLLMIPVGVALFGYVLFFFWVTRQKKEAENK